MFILVPLILAFMLLGSLAEGQVHTGTRLSSEQIFAANKTAVVQIHVTGTLRNNKTDERWGTGFIFHKDGYLFTAGHVVGATDEWLEDLNSGNPKRTIEVTGFTDNNTSRRFEGATIQYYDSQLDLALLRVTCTDCRTVKLGNSSRVKPGMNLHAIGWGDRVQPEPISGQATNPYESRYGGLMKLNMNLSAGDSGGPVFDDSEGHVIAIIKAGKSDRKGFTFGSPINLAAGLVNMTWNTAAVEESIELLTKIRSDEKVPIFPNVQAKFKEVEASLRTLNEISEGLKQNVRLVPAWQHQKDPEGSDIIFLLLRVETDFKEQYLPQEIKITVHPGWRVTPTVEESKKHLWQMTPSDSKDKDLTLSDEAKGDRIERAYREGKPLSFNIGPALRNLLKSKYQFSDPTLSSLTITGADLEMEWKIPNVNNPRKKFVPLGAPSQ